MPRKEVRYCTRCIIPDKLPGVTFDDQGVCSYCNHFDRHLGQWYLDPSVSIKARHQLEQTIRWAKRQKRKYDCIVPTSGGRDSIFVLHLCKTEFGLNPLVFTIDNGFWASGARERLTSIVNQLGIDHVVYHPDWMTELYQLFLKEALDFCAPCNYLIFHKTAEVAFDNRIPLIVMGGCQRLDTILPTAPDPWLFRSVISSNRSDPALQFYSRFPWKFFVYYALIGRRLQPLDHLNWTFEERQNILEKCYGIQTGQEHEDCLAHDTVEYIAQRISRLKKYGITFKTMKYSQLIRNNLMARDEAFRTCESDYQKGMPSSVDYVLGKIGIHPEELEAIIAKQPNIQQFLHLPDRLVQNWRRFSFNHGIPQNRFFPDL